MDGFTSMQHHFFAIMGNEIAKGLIRVNNREIELLDIDTLRGIIDAH